MDGQFSTALYQVAGNRGVDYHDVHGCYPWMLAFFRGRESHSPCASGSMWNDLWALMRSLLSFFSACSARQTRFGGCERQSLSVNVAVFQCQELVTKRMMVPRFF